MRSTLARLIIAASFGAVCLAQGSPQAFYNNQVQNYWRALQDPTTNLRVQRIWLDLVTHSRGEMYPVIPAQQFTLGQALPNGAVLLDLSVAGDPDEEVTAFWLGHEYGHQVLRHPQLGATPWGQFMVMKAGTANEDSADRWSARFMKAQHYDVNPAIEFLCKLPSAGLGDSHSSGPERARNVAAAYGAGATANCDVTDGGSGGGRTLRRVPCQHRTTCQHTMACVHQGLCSHSMPCQHIFMTPYGPRQMHPFDTLHAFDTAHQYDALHPFDLIHEYDEVR